MKCEFCKTAISAENCRLAVVRNTEDDKEYAFCCTRCAKAPEKKQE